MTWELVVTLGVILIGGTIVVGAFIEKGLNELLNIKHGYTDEHEDSSIG